MFTAALTRANVYVRNSIIGRSRSPTTVETSILSRSRGVASSFPRTGGGSQKLRIIAVVAFYRLKASIRVLNLAPPSRTVNTVFQSTIQAGEIVESISAPNQNGRILVRHDGQCYRAWKEELQNAYIAERLLRSIATSG